MTFDKKCLIFVFGKGDDDFSQQMSMRPDRQNELL